MQIVAIYSSLKLEKLSVLAEKLSFLSDAFAPHSLLNLD